MRSDIPWRRHCRTGGDSKGKCMMQEQIENQTEQEWQIREEIFCICTNYLRNHSKEELDEIINHAAEIAGFFGGKGEMK